MQARYPREWANRKSHSAKDRAPEGIEGSTPSSRITDRISKQLREKRTECKLGTRGSGQIGKAARLRPERRKALRVRLPPPASQIEYRNTSDSRESEERITSTVAISRRARVQPESVSALVRIVDAPQDHFEKLIRAIDDSLKRARFAACGASYDSIAPKGQAVDTPAPSPIGRVGHRSSS